MKIMQRDAKLVLTSYDLPKVGESISTILKNAPQFDIEIKKPPFDQKIGQSDDEPKLWGCDGNDVIRKAMILRGSFSNMRDLVRIQTPEGVLIELLPSDNP